MAAAAIPLQRAADLLNACNRYIQEQLAGNARPYPTGRTSTPWRMPSLCVEIISNALAEDHASQGDLILDVAEESLDSLGYLLKEKPSILDRIDTPVETFAPLADPLLDMDVLVIDRDRSQPAGAGR